MAFKLVGIVDFNGQAHCLDHAASVSSYRDEIYSVDPARECWCGVTIAGEKLPPVSHYNRMNDGIKGKRAPSRRLIVPINK